MTLKRDKDELRKREVMHQNEFALALEKSDFNLQRIFFEGNKPGISFIYANQCTEKM